MNKLRFLSTIAALGALAFTSCSENDEPIIQGDRVALSINAGIGVQTRATDASWSANDGIGIFMVDAGTTDVTGTNMNLHYVAQSDGANTSFEANNVATTAYFPGGKAPVDIYAYYPYAGTTTSLAEVTVDVSEQSNLPAIDLMVAKTNAPQTSENPSVALNFTHRLSKFVVNLAVDESADGVTLAGAELTLTGTSARGTYNLYDNTMEYGATADIALAINAAGTKATAIVMPTNTDSGAALKISTASGKNFTAEFPSDLALENGKETTVTITLRQTSAEMTATITDWVEGPTATMQTLQVTIPDGPEGNPQVTEFELWKNDDEAGAVSYTWSNDQWTTDTTPFYVEDIQSGDLFSARHTPQTGSPEKDIMEAAPVAANQGLIALDFAHINTKFTATLVGSTDYPNVSSGTLAVNGLYGTGDYAITSGSASIFQPKELTASDVIKVTLDGHTYTVVLADITTDEGKLTELEAGTAYAISLSIVKSAISATATVVDWTAVEGSATTKVDVAENINITGLTEDGELQITNESHVGTYKYTFTTDKFEAINPIYWEDIESTNPAFDIFFTPDAAGKPEKDYIRGSAMEFWGVPLNVVNFRHINTKVKVTIVPGAGYNAQSDISMTITDLETSPAEYPINSGEAYIFKYKTLAATDKIKVTADGVNYEVALTDITVGAGKLAALESGKSYDITLTVAKSGLSLTATVEDWTTVEGSGSIEY